MIATTPDFEIAAKANYRDPRARVRISWVDSTSESTLSSSTPDENRAAIMEQVTNTITTTTRKWMHCSTATYTARPILDGSCHPMPSDLLTGEVGWYGTTQCNATGTWPIDPYLDITFSSRAFVNTLIVIQCDTKYNEYPSEFTLKLYDGVSLEHTYTTTTNTATTINVDLSGYSFDSITKVELTINKWSAPYGIVKINEVRFTTQNTYTGSDIVSLDITEEMETEGGSLPIGNITSNEINLSLINTDDRFTYGNTDSIYSYLVRSNVKIEVWLGFVLASGTSDVSSGDYIVETEGSDKVGYHPYGVYWSDDWITDRRSLTVRTFARDRMEHLRKAEFDDSLLYEDVTLYDLATTVMESAALKITDGLTWDINTSLKNTVIPMAYFPIMSYFQAIKKIAIAGLTTAYVNRTGTVVIGVSL